MSEKHPNSLANLQKDSSRKPFTSTDQPANRGRKKTKDIQKLMRAFGHSMAPPDLLDDPTVNHFIEQNKLRGTVHEVLVARLYALALYTNDIKAIKLILDTLNGSYKGGKGVIINFIAPPTITQEEEIDLSNDSWTVQAPKED